MWMVERLAQAHREELRDAAQAWREVRAGGPGAGESRAASLRVLIGTRFVRAGLRLGGALPAPPAPSPDGQACE